MAKDYDLLSYNQFRHSGGGPELSGGPLTFGGMGTDDGTWDLGDLATDSGSFTFQGYYEAGGHKFLVWSGISSTLIGSPTAPVSDPGYPADYASLPALNTTALATCFAAGTFISCSNGDVPVEQLQIGDTLVTQSDERVCVKWIGRQTLHKWQLGQKIQPVRIAADTFGRGLPYCDLIVTADHGMVVDGYVVNASALINGDTINWVSLAELDDSFTVYHIETERHNVILANGTPTETFIDAAGRAAFDNYQEYLDLYGVERIVPEMAIPRISSARLIPLTIQQKLRIAASTKQQICA